MTDSQSPDQKTVSVRTAEITVAILFMMVAVVVMYDSWRIGAQWGDFGPQSGFFPFYVGLAMFASSALTLFSHIQKSERDSLNFVGKSQFWLVLKVFLPTVVFVALIGQLGIYFSAAIYLAFFMWWIGGYQIQKSIPAGAVLACFLFWLFEQAFKVPLPKGPLEAALGF
ncbi:MAG: tripartite tricarboxylate transporter TctB family protein [Hyphomicrobiales bacterium]|nr:tripartite tricarboxylate transporter TctB family protein [Hyphomicrobiales bacterium]